jgi:hypothetical protein
MVNDSETGFRCNSFRVEEQSSGKIKFVRLIIPLCITE